MRPSRTSRKPILCCVSFWSATMRSSCSCVTYPARCRRLPRRFSRRRALDSAATTCPPRNEIVIESSSPSMFNTPVFRCRPSIWKMSVSEKTLSVPSRPTGSPPRRHLSLEPEHGRQDRADHDARPPGALGRKGERVEELSVDDRRRNTGEEEKQSDRAGDRATVAEGARARSHQRD